MAPSDATMGAMFAAMSLGWLFLATPLAVREIYLRMHGRWPTARILCAGLLIVMVIAGLVMLGFAITELLGDVSESFMGVVSDALITVYFFEVALFIIMCALGLYSRLRYGKLP